MPSVNDIRISTATGQATFGVPVPFPTPVAASHAVPVPVVPSSHGGPGGRTGTPSGAEQTALSPHRPMMAALRTDEDHAPSELPASAQMFSFSIQFADTGPNEFLDVPEGWNITEPTTGVIQVEHTVGRLPAFVAGYGLTTDPKVWKQCIFGSAMLYVSYDAADSTQFALNGVSSKAMNATGLRARVHIFF